MFERPVAPPPATGGRSSYCDDPDHTATTAFRTRRSQSRTEEESLERPASIASAVLRETVVCLGHMLGEFGALTAQALERLEVATNPEAVQAELAAMRAETLQAVAGAQAQLATERQARLVADEAAEAMSAEAEAARQYASSAEARAQATDERVGEAEAARREAIAQMHEATQRAEAAERARGVAEATQGAAELQATDAIARAEAAEGERGRALESARQAEVWPPRPKPGRAARSKSATPRSHLPINPAMRHRWPRCEPRGRPQSGQHPSPESADHAYTGIGGLAETRLGSTWIRVTPSGASIAFIVRSFRCIHG